MPLRIIGVSIISNKICILLGMLLGLVVFIEKHYELC
jgi:hypothetical protein